MIEDSGNAKLREATVAGIFYPEEPAELEARIASLLDRARPSTRGAYAIVSPHAGLEYSGDLAALAWKSASARAVKRVLVLAPYHRAEESLVYLPEAEAFATPLGMVRVDTALVEELRDCGTLFSVNDIPHFEEHGVEVQLPFMRLLFPEASLVPLVVGKPGQALIKSLASALGIVFGGLAEDSLVVLSADLSSGADEELVRRQGSLLAEAVRRLDGEAALEAGSLAGAPACSGHCLASFFASPLAAGLEGLILGRHDSSAARQSGDERLVEYLAAAFVRPGGEDGPCTSS